MAVDKPGLDRDGRDAPMKVVYEDQDEDSCEDQGEFDLEAEHSGPASELNGGRQRLARTPQVPVSSMFLKASLLRACRECSAGGARGGRR